MVIDTICVDYGYANAIAITPDGSQIFVTSVSEGTGIISVFDTATNKPVGEPVYLPKNVEAFGIAITPDPLVRKKTADAKYFPVRFGKGILR